MKTPQVFRRDSLKEIFDKTLQSHQISLSPVDMLAEEACTSDFTLVELTIAESSVDKTNTIRLREEKAKGFVDGMFKACYNQYIDQSPSLRNIKLIDFQVKPNFKKSINNSGTDAKTEVTLMVEVKGRGISEFSSISRSIMYSSFVAILDAFQFYINCERSFDVLIAALTDAKQRNRYDIAEQCKFRLSKITEANTYEKKYGN